MYIVYSSFTTKVVGQKRLGHLKANFLYNVYKIQLLVVKLRSCSERESVVQSCRGRVLKKTLKERRTEDWTRAKTSVTWKRTSRRVHRPTMTWSHLIQLRPARTGSAFVPRGTYSDVDWQTPVNERGSSSFSWPKFGPSSTQQISDWPINVLTRTATVEYDAISVLLQVAIAIIYM